MNFKINSNPDVSTGNSVQFPPLPSGTVHIWHVYFDQIPGLVEKCKSVLSEVELGVIRYYKFDQAKKSYIVSHGTLRILLSNYLGIQPDKLKIARSRKGKPYSLDDPGLHFNLSNSGKSAVFAFSHDTEVGIDLEFIRPLSDLDELINKNFTPSEIKFINNEPTEKNKRFFRFWTIKESYLKAIGEGMRLSPNNLEFAIQNNEIKQLAVAGLFELQDWGFKEFSLGNDYVGTVTYAHQNAQIEQMEFSSILD